MRSSPKLPKSAYAGIKIGKQKQKAALLIEGKVETYEAPKSSDTTSWIEKIASSNKSKIIAAAVHGEGDLQKLGSRLWLKADIVPLIVHNGLQKDPEDLALFAASRFVDDIITINLKQDKKVQVTDLVTLSDYQKITPAEDFRLLIKFSDKLKNKRIVYFSATPRGGGVALMRHALMRLYRLLGVDASWHVMQESLDVFNITKKKFHNVLHGIASPNVRLTQKDKKIYTDWIQDNARRLHSLFHQANVIVIDDPQPSGLVPYIRKASPNTKIVYRSHIQLETALMEKPKSPQNITWNFIWENIKSADLFVSHSVEKFVPKMVDRKKVALMTAAIDPLDGLSKPLTKDQMDYYLNIFNKLLLQSGQTPLERNRPAIVQVARFDPSKGIPDVIASFMKLRKLLRQEQSPIAPQLVITGQGSVDDPEGLPIVRRTISAVRGNRDREIVGDIKILRTPATDQIQNSLMRTAKIYLQLSHKEGFEDKISGALMMGVPTIIYNAGGMPLQVVHGRSGFIVEVRNTDKVARHMFDLLTDQRLYRTMSADAKKLVLPEATIVNNAINWLFIANELVYKGEVRANMQKVFALARSR